MRCLHCDMENKSIRICFHIYLQNMNYFLVIFCIFLIFIQLVVITSLSDSIPVPIITEQCCNDSNNVDFNAYTPLVNCSYLSEEFTVCEAPVFLNGNKTAKADLQHGCTVWGGQRYDEVERTRVWCNVLDGIECYGERRFLSLKDVPCIKYSGHYFVSTLIYSVLLGFLGMDRFCLGNTGTAVGKLLTLGGVGIWWIVDIILLVSGELQPEDGSNWVPFY